MKRVKETMSKPAERNLIVGLDIGTSQVKAVVGELLEDDQISIVGVGTHASWHPVGWHRRWGNVVP